MTYEDVAAQAELPPETARRFVSYMRVRWARQEVIQCGTGYAQEWARRFADGVEYGASDRHGQAVLRQLDSQEARS